jgi:hypothetical protein
VSDVERTARGVVRLIRHKANRGKGAAIRTAIEAASGDYCLVQMRTLEYDPRDYPRLLPLARR